MWLRKVDPSVIVSSYIMVRKAGLDISLEILECHYLAHGNVPDVVRALIAASRGGYPLTFQEAAAMDLKGENVLHFIQTQIEKNNPPRE